LVAGNSFFHEKTFASVDFGLDAYPCGYHQLWNGAISIWKYDQLGG
jgi:hypothetical protein